MAIYCTQCGHKISREKYCPECGTTAPALPPADKKKTIGLVILGVSLVILAAAITLGIIEITAKGKKATPTTAPGTTQAGIVTSKSTAISPAITTSTAQPSTGPTGSTPDQELVQKVMAIYSDYLKGSAKVQFDQQKLIFRAIPTQAALIKSIEEARNQDPDALKAWAALVGNLVGLSKDAESIVPGSALSIQDPANPEEVLLIVKYTEIIYDFTKN